MNNFVEICSIWQFFSLKRSVVASTRSSTHGELYVVKCWSETKKTIYVIYLQFGGTFFVGIFFMNACWNTMKLKYKRIFKIIGVLLTFEWTLICCEVSKCLEEFIIHWIFSTNFLPTAEPCATRQFAKETMWFTLPSRRTVLLVHFPGICILQARAHVRKHCVKWSCFWTFLVLIKLCHFATLPLIYTFETEIVFCVCPAVYGSTRSNILLLTDELENTCHPWTGLAFFSSARNPFALSVETPIRYEKNMRLATYNHFAIMLKLVWKQ